MQFVFIVVLITILCIFTAKDVLALDMPTGNALILEGTTKVVLPEFAFGGPFTVEVWAKADFSNTPGPLVFFGNSDTAGAALDQVELGISAGGVLYIYLELGVSDAAAFRAQLPTNQQELNTIKRHLTTNPDVSPLIRSVTWEIPAEYSNQWFLIDIRATANGVISCYLNRQFVGQTSALDIGVLPAFLVRSLNTFGYNLATHFVGGIQVVTLWNRAVASRDILGGTTNKLNDGGLVGRWDFSNVKGDVVFNLAANDLAAVSSATEGLQAQLAILQQEIYTAEQNLKQAMESNSGDLEALRSALAATQLALDRAKSPSGGVSGSISYANVAPADLSSFTTNLNAISNGDLAYTSIQQIALAVQERTTNTLNDLAPIASQQNGDDNLYLRLALDATNKLPFRSKDNNARSGIQTNFPVDATEIKNFASAKDRIDGTIVQDAARKRLSFDFLCSQQVSPKLDLLCGWYNDPHYIVMPLNGSFMHRFDYHSPNCHIILKVGNEVQILEQSYRCGASAGCISSVGAFIKGRFVVIFYADGTVTVNYAKVKLPYTVTDGVSLSYKYFFPTLVVDGLYELVFTGAAVLRFTSDQYFNADNRSLCIQNRNPVGPNYYNTMFDLDPTECFLNQATWIPPTNQCPPCQHGGTPGFTLQQGCFCTCQSGWEGDVCQTYRCDSCVSGKCTGPNECTCFTTDPDYIFGCSDCSCYCSRTRCQNNGTVSFDAQGNCVCACTDEYEGDLCQNIRCPSGSNGRECSGQGSCLSNGTCICFEHVSFGIDCAGNCSAQVCPTDAGKTCGGHGYCDCGHCVCNKGFLGDACSIPDCSNTTGSPDQSGCGAHGICDGSGQVPVCKCNPGWSDLKCSTYTCNNCSVHGVCQPTDPPYCGCYPGFIGESCGQYSCAFLGNCHTPKGTCNFTEGVDQTPKCQCGEHWSGQQCEIPKCLNDCSQHGQCIDSAPDSLAAPTCKCDSPYLQNVPDCSVLPDCIIGSDQWSSPEWQARATSICTNTSFIAPTFRDDCLFDAQQIDNYEVLFNTAQQTLSLYCNASAQACQACPNYCNFNGLCNSKNAVCTCDPGFYGADCSIQPYRRTYFIRYDNGRQEAELNPIVKPASPVAELDATPGAGSHTGNEVANGLVVFLYRDYRPKYGQCTPYNDLYLFVQIDKPGSSCSVAAPTTFRFTLFVNDTANAPATITNLCVTRRNAPNTIDFTCQWRFATDASAIIGPLSQNTSFVLNLNLPTLNTCLNSVYYGTEELTGHTDLVPIPDQMSQQIQIVSEVRNSVCGVITSCSACMAAVGCGWCPDLAYCLEGTQSGPSIGTCSVWRYTTDPRVSRVVTTTNFGQPVYPATTVYLVPNSPLTVYLYTVFPAQISLETIFFIDSSSGMSSFIPTFKQQAAQLLIDMQATYPGSAAGAYLFCDIPVAPYGADLVYGSLTWPQTTDNATFARGISKLRTFNCGDSPNAQLIALLLAATNAQTSFTGPSRIAVVITRTPFHTPPNAGLIPNDLDGYEFGPPYEDYPYVADVRSALLASNIVPVFVVLDSAVLPDYNNLVSQLGFGVVVSATDSSVPPAVLRGIQQVFTSAKMFAPSSKYVTSIYPVLPYTSIGPGKRVRFAVTLDRNAVKRDIVTYDGTVVLTVPGFGSTTIRLVSTDVPVGTDQHYTNGRENMEQVLTFNGDNVYHTSLAYQIVSMPNGTLLQYDTRAVITVDTFLTDPNHRVIYIPPPNASCQHQGSDYCSRKRYCNNPCPFTTLKYAVVDTCSAKSKNVTVLIDVLATVQNNQPRALLSSNVVTNEDTRTPIYLSGTDSDNEPLTSVITVLPTTGTTEYLNVTFQTITNAMLPFTVPDRTIYYTPPYHRYGDNLASFTYLVNDGHKSYELGDSIPLKVTISVALTDHAPAARDVLMLNGREAETTVYYPQTLQVTDQDAIDYTRGEVSVRMLEFPPANVGYFTQADQVTNITQANPQVSISTVSGQPTWTIYLVVMPYVNGTYSFRYRASDTQFNTDATATFNIAFVNQRPIVQDMLINVNDTGPVTITMNARDIEGDSYVFGFAGGPKEGTLTDPVSGRSYTSSDLYFELKRGNKVIYTPVVAPSHKIQTLSYFANDQATPFFGNYASFRLAVNHVNVVPNVVSSTTTYRQTGSAGVPITLTLANINVYDVDAGTAPLAVTISLSGPDLATPACATPVTTATTITFTCSQYETTQALLSGLTYTTTPQSSGSSSSSTSTSTAATTATITIAVSDRGQAQAYGPTGTGSLAITVQTSLAVTGNSVGVTVGAVGAGAAAAVGLAVTYHFLKMKKVLTDETNPFAGMGNEVDSSTTDVVLDNPLYQQPR